MKLRLRETGALFLCLMKGVNTCDTKTAEVL
nr:MAG TPA: hypothetical protein [Caudoviricetes sp.]